VVEERVQGGVFASSPFSQSLTCTSTPVHVPPRDNHRGCRRTLPRHGWCVGRRKHQVEQPIISDSQPIKPDLPSPPEARSPGRGPCPTWGGQIRLTVVKNCFCVRAAQKSQQSGEATPSPGSLSAARKHFP
jgi:hypothetical protein